VIANGLPKDILENATVQNVYLGKEFA
jgi:ABC-type lipopolysaccharide export system ATPase subunit